MPSFVLFLKCPQCVTQSSSPTWVAGTHPLVTAASHGLHQQKAGLEWTWCSTQAFSGGTQWFKHAANICSEMMF